jgi:hypothetical protein
VKNHEGNLEWDMWVTEQGTDKRALILPFLSIFDAGTFGLMIESMSVKCQIGSRSIACLSVKTWQHLT